MKFSWLFLSEFITIAISPDELAERLTLAGLEVVSIEKHGKDVTFEVEVTANRPDLLSMIGIAHEVGALLGKKPKLPTSLKPGVCGADIAIDIEDRADCPVYIGRIIRNVGVRPSPAWLQARLGACGINSINNVVDITNYCMLKWGQPMHAFDLAKIDQKIIVRRARNKESLVCIDNKERSLHQGNLVIADGKKVLALAGIIGGKQSEVSAASQDILLETAIFSPLVTRRVCRGLGLTTESSYRFERGVNPCYIEQASAEAAARICQLSGAELTGYKRTGSLPRARKVSIVLDCERMNNFLGTAIKEQQASKILHSLGFEIHKEKGASVVNAPAFRQDISIAEDVYEEIARIWGYHKVVPVLPAIKREIGEPPSLYRFKETARQKVANLGFKEVMTYSVISRQYFLSIFGQGTAASEDELLQSAVKLINPLRESEDVLRPEVFLGILQVCKHNIYRKQSGLDFFEIADTYIRKGKSFAELTKLCIGSHSETLDDFYVFKGKIERLLREYGIHDISCQEQPSEIFPSRYVLEDLGWVGLLGQAVAKRMDLKNVFIAEIDVEQLYKKANPPVFKEINYFPWIERDVSIALRKDIKFKVVEKIVTQQAGSLLKDYKIVDTYKGDKIEQDYFGCTLRISYQHQSRTLEAQEVDQLHVRLREALSNEEGLLLR